MRKNKEIKNNKNIQQNHFKKILIYKTPNGKVNVEVFLHNENIWLTQKRMAELFNVGIPAINKHLSNIFESGELNENSVISILEITAEDGKNYRTKFYNLDAIISVGYRVNSAQATQFRTWATERLKEKKTKQEIVYQVFIEPKNEMLAKAEPWKEEFLLAIEKKYTILKLLKWKIKILNYWGYHFLMTWES